MSIDIKNLGGSLVTRGETRNTVTKKTSTHTDASNASAANPATADTLTLTDTAQQLLTELKTSLAEAPPLDQSRVDDLRNSIARQTYEVNSLRVAEKFLRLEGALTPAENSISDAQG